MQGVARAIEWSRDTPREQVIARFSEIIRKRGRTENDAAIKYWRSFGVNGRGGTIAEREFQLWIDWMVKDGELAPGQIAASSVYTNELNPYFSEASIR